MLKGLQLKDLFLEMKNFKELGLSKGMLDVLQNHGFDEPTEIQEKAIPLVLAGRDIIGGSATGSGKTLAFATPIIENLKPNNKVQALILTPTRELAEQVLESIRKFSKNKPLNLLAVYGGVDINNQTRKIPKSDVIVGTPGRILDHMQRNTLNLSNVKFLVLDEVDRMFDMGFHKDVEKIISQCPKNRQTMLFSATISSNIDHLAKKYTKNPAEVSVNSHVDPSKLEQVYYNVEPYMKFSLLVNLLKQEHSDLVMVFCNTRNNVDFVANNLIRNGISAKAIHGGMEQNKRLRVLSEFHGKGVTVLVCTDVAARGLDIKDVSHVYNYDLPKSSDDYIHRIGRTARAGEDGIAISLLCNKDYDNFNKILEDEHIKIKEVKIHKFDMINVNTDMERKRGGFPQRGNSRGYQGNNFSRGPSRGHQGSNQSRGPSNNRSGYQSNNQSRGYSGNSRGYQGNNQSRGPSNNRSGYQGNNQRSRSPPRDSSRGPSRGNFNRKRR